MKALLATSFAALLLVGAVTANAASQATPATPGATTATTVSTPFASGNRGSEALPVFNYQGSVPLTASIRDGRTIGIAPWNVDLARQTGGAH